jgi:autotransporter-associated beta strand protein
LTLSGANTFGGGVTLSAGTLNLGSTTALGATAGTFTIGGGTLDSTVAGLVNAKNNPIIINGDFAFAGTNGLDLGTGAVSLGAAAGTSRTITVNAGNLTFGGTISNGTTATTLVKAGIGTLTTAAIAAGTVNHNAGTLHAASVTSTNFNVYSTANVTGAVTLTGMATVGNGKDAATLNSGTLRADSLTIRDQGAVTLAAGSDTHVLSGLTFDGAPDAPLGKLDLQDGRLAVHYTDYQAYLDIQQNIRTSARWSPDDLASMWDTGTGITSQLLTDSPNSGFALGYADNGALDSLYQFGPTKPFGDYAIPEELVSTTVLVRYTVIGDVNLDGVVDGNDIFIIVANYGMTGMDWQNGDVVAYDGVVGADDVFTAVAYYGMTASGGMVGDLAPLDVGQLESSLGLGGLGAVPEPATLGLMILGAVAMLARRRRAAK